MPHTQANPLTARLMLLLTVAAGLAIGNLYWAQPLLTSIATDLGRPSADGGFLMTATQAGYALGILLIVPLGDFLNRRRLIPCMICLSVGFLILCALAPSFSVLLFAIMGLGITTVSGQIILPFVGDLAPANQKGRMVGIIGSGVTTGILLSRVISGIIADILGWRAVYLGAALLNLLIFLLLRNKIPALAGRAPIPYTSIIGSVFQTARRVHGLFPILFVSGLTFALFNIFWVVLTFLLSAEPFCYTTFQIGLVGLAGVTGSLISQGAGRLMDMGYEKQALAGFFAFLAASMLLPVCASHSLFALVLAAAVVSLATQGICVLAQVKLFGLDPDARSRLNTLFVVSNFIWAATGSALAAGLWK